MPVIIPYICRAPVGRPTVTGDTMPDNKIAPTARHTQAPAPRMPPNVTIENDIAVSDILIRRCCRVVGIGAAEPEFVGEITRPYVNRRIGNVVIQVNQYAIDVSPIAVKTQRAFGGCSPHNRSLRTERCCRRRWRDGYIPYGNDRRSLCCERCCRRRGCSSRGRRYTDRRSLRRERCTRRRWCGSGICARSIDCREIFVIRRVCRIRAAVRHKTGAPCRKTRIRRTHAQRRINVHVN